MTSEMNDIDGQPLDYYNEYHAFYGWLKKDITSKNINVKNNLRKTKKNPKWNLKSKIWFFGGSTMWGAYVSDENTIPSLSSDLNHDFYLFRIFVGPRPRYPHNRLRAAISSNLPQELLKTVEYELGNVLGSF